MTRQLTIITGASSGIGAAIAAAALESPSAGSVVATISRRSGPGTHLAADLADPASWSSVAAWIDQLITADVERVALIHNAGTLDPIGFAGEVDHDRYTANVLLNSASVQVIGAAFLASMARADLPGVYMNISSGAGKNPFAGWSSYCAGKAAGDMWIRTAGIELDARASAVRVVSVSPGVVATAMQAEIRSAETAAFPNVARFHELFEQGNLADPAQVGAKLYALANRHDLPQGGVFSVDDTI
ncbi:MAG: SDR family NAD(P)-dependent oxidoreductase [Acidimicrobiales bacterium]